MDSSISLTARLLGPIGSLYNSISNVVKPQCIFNVLNTAYIYIYIYSNGYTMFAAILVSHNVLAIAAETFTNKMGLQSGSK